MFCFSFFFFHFARRTKLDNSTQDIFIAKGCMEVILMKILYIHYVYERKLTEVSKHLIHTSYLLLSSPHSD